MGQTRCPVEASGRLQQEQDPDKRPGALQSRMPRTVRPLSPCRLPAPVTGQEFVKSNRHAHPQTVCGGLGNCQTVNHACRMSEGLASTEHRCPVAVGLDRGEAPEQDDVPPQGQALHRQAYEAAEQDADCDSILYSMHAALRYAVRPAHSTLLFRPDLSPWMVRQMPLPRT